MPVKQPPTSKFWSATTPLEVARGAAVAETVTMDTVAKEQFYMGTSPVVLELRLAEPTDDQIVMALLKSIEECPKRKQAFVEAMHVPFKCTTTASSKKAAREIRIAERARATLDGGKELQTDETIVAGGRNATRFAAALAMNSKSAPTLAEVYCVLKTMQHCAAFSCAPSWRLTSRRASSVSSYGSTCQTTTSWLISSSTTSLRS